MENSGGKIPQISIINKPLIWCKMLLTLGRWVPHCKDKQNLKKNLQGFLKKIIIKKKLQPMLFPGMLSTDLFQVSR